MSGLDRAFFGLFLKNLRTSVESTRNPCLLSGFFVKKALKLYRNQPAMQARCEPQFFFLQKALELQANQPAVNASPQVFFVKRPSNFN
jgi:hypothetical protein